MSATPESVETPTFLAAGGEMGRLMRAHDWSASPLGEPERWPLPLKTLVGVMLAAGQPMFVAWGSERTLLYNDAYVDIIATKHPDALGRDFLKVWYEISDFLEPVVAEAYAGRPVQMDDVELTVERKGYSELAHFAFSFTPVRDEGGHVGGFFCAAMETTDQVLAHRRRVALLELDDRLRDVVDTADLSFAASKLLGEAMGAARVGYGVVEAEARTITVERNWCVADLDDVAGVHRFADYGSYVDNLLRGEPVKNADVAEDPRTADNIEAFRAIGVRAFLDMPVVEDGRIVAQMFVHSATPRVWTAEELAFVRDFAERTRAVIARRLAEQALAEAERRLSAAVDAAGLSADFRALFEASPTPFLVVAPPDWTIVAANDSRLRVTGKTREEQIGRRLFDLFPDDPNDPTADGVKNLTASFERVIATRTGDAMAVQRYAVQGPDGRYIERWWSPVNSPVLDRNGAVTLIIHRVEDVTETVQLRGEAEARDQLSRDQQAIIDRLRTSEAALRESEARQRFRVELGDALRGLTSPGEIMAEVAERLGKHLRVDQANYYRIEGDRFVVSEEWRSDASGGMIGDHALAGFGESLPTRMEAGEMLRFDDTSEAEGAHAYAAVGMAAVLSAPLRSGGRWAGGFHVHAVGPRIWTDEEAALVRDTAERAWEAVERARAEAELRTSEEFNRRVLASSSDCIKVLSLDGELEFMSEGGMCVMEVDDFDPIKGACWPDFWSGDTHDLARAAVAEARRGGTGRFQGFARTMKGSPRWWDVAVTPIDGANGVPEKLLSVSRDITEQRRAEERLREMNETLETQVAERTAELGRVWQLSHDLLVIAEADGTLRSVNAAWTALLGWDEAELVGTTFVRLTHPDDLGSTLAAFAGILETPLVAPFEYRLQHKDGTYRWFAWTASFERGAVYANGRDVTAAKEAAAELVQAQEALRQSQKMEAMGSLTGGVAHDFNNLLTPIIGSLDMLVRKGIGSERERRLIDGALQSAERAKMLVQRLLAFARRQPLQPVAVDVGRLVDGMAGLIGSTLGPMIDVHVDLAPDLPPAQADLNQLEMALLNLAVNARDAMPDGGELSIAAKRESVRGGHKSGVKPGHYVRLGVTDSGVGMNQATIARAVEPFFSTKGIGKGTGLGLSMVHGLAAQLGGGLTIESEPGRGTSIELWLPISGTVVGEDGEAVTTPSARIGRGTALLVDDEELVRMSTADMLVDLGFEVVEVGSAQEALGLMNAGAVPDLLVTDHLMPGMTGAELAQEARALKPALPVLVVSGYAEVEGIAPELPRLTKPFRSAELAASLAALIPAVDT